MKRPLVVVSFGLVIGIIWGVFLKEMRIPLLLLYFLFFLFVKKEQKKTFLLWACFSCIGMAQIGYIETRYEKPLESLHHSQIWVQGMIVSEKEEKQYQDQYLIKGERLFYILLPKSTQELHYGDLVEIKGEFRLSQGRRNEKGFDHNLYLKSKGIYGTIRVEQIQKIAENKAGYIGQKIHEWRKNLKKQISLLFPEGFLPILQALLLGDTSLLDPDTKEEFRKSSLSHILAISGMHISYLIAGITFLFKKISIPRNISYLFVIMLLLLFMGITGFSASTVRASLSGILLLISKLCHRKQDLLTSLSISILLLLSMNPYAICNVGLQFSYLGVLGIYFFYEKVTSFFRAKLPSYQRATASFLKHGIGYRNM